MGCGRMREGLMGNLRSSMERRRVANAKMTALRYRRYQEVRMRMEEDEMRKATEVLESRKKEQERLNQYIHSLHQPPVKPSLTSRYQKQGNITRGDLYKRTPWKISLIQDEESIFKLRQKEISLLNVGFCNLRRREHDPMLQVRATAIRDAMVDLRACNSRFPLNITDRNTVFGTEDSYLKNHILRSDLSAKKLHNLDGQQLDAQTNVDNEISITEPFLLCDSDIKASKTRPCTGQDAEGCVNLDKGTSANHHFTKTKTICTQTSSEFGERPTTSTIPPSQATNGGRRNSAASFTYDRDMKKISSDGITRVPFQDLRRISVGEVPSSRHWREIDGETTSYLTEELFLASLENEAAPARLIQQITKFPSDPYKLITLGSKNSPRAPSNCGEFDCGMAQDTAEVLSKNMNEGQVTFAQMLPIQGFQRALARSNHVKNTLGVQQMKDTDKPAPDTTDRPKKTVMVHPSRVTPSNENTNCSMDAENIVTLRAAMRIESVPKKYQDMAPPDTIRLLHSMSTTHDCSTSDARMLSQKTCVLSALYSKSPDASDEKTDNLEPSDQMRLTSSQNMAVGADNVEDRGRGGGFPMGLSINQQGQSSNSGSSTQRSSRLGSRKLVIPQRLMQSVYERCDLDSVKSPGYTTLCSVTHNPKEHVVKLSKGDCLADSRASSQPINTTMTLQSGDAQEADHGSPIRDEINVYHDASSNKENLGKKNYSTDLCAPKSKEELSILVSLEKLDWKLAAINGRALSTRRNSLNSQGQISSKSAQSAPAVLTHDGPFSTTLGQANLAIGKSKNGRLNPTRPSSARFPPIKPPRGHRQRRVVGVTNKCHGKIHQFHPKRWPNCGKIILPGTSNQHPNSSCISRFKALAYTTFSYRLCGVLRRPSLSQSPATDFNQL